MKYPHIDQNSIWGMLEFVESVKQSPELLQDPECPYPAEFTALIAKITPKAKKDKTELEGEKSGFDDIDQEIKTIYEELDDFKDGLGADTEGQVYVSYMRLRAQLLTKMLEVKERLYNVKSMKLFQERLLKGVDAVLTPEQRTKFIEYLEGKL